MSRHNRKNTDGIGGKPSGGGLNREILLTLVFLVSAALLFGGLLFLRYVERDSLKAWMRLVQQGNRLAAEKLAAPGRFLNDAEHQALAAELSVIDWSRYDSRLNLVDRLAFTDRSRLSKGKLLEIAGRRDAVLEMKWPGLVAIFLGKKVQPTATVVSSLTDTEGQAGILVGIFSLQPVAEGLVKVSRWIFIYTLLYGGILSLIGYVLLRRNVILPVKRLAEATEKVAGGYFEGQIPEQGPTEISKLARRFNEMVDALRQSRKITDSHIEQLRQANRQLRQTNDDLIRSEKMATVGYLAAGMAHELGNPLAALTGYLAVLQEDIRDQEQRRIVTSARFEAERMDRLVRDLLDFAGPEAPGDTLVAPWKVVCQTIDLLMDQGVLKKHFIDFDVDLDLPAVRIDPGRLEQVLVNLLLNARDASDEGSRIEVQGRATHQSVEIAVKDHGSGIEADNLRRIFEPFFTTKDPGRGRGLGLAVCQRILADAGGRLQVESEHGKGSVFTLILPTETRGSESGAQ